MDMKPMLAEPADPKMLPTFIADPNLGFEQKVDGHRVMIVVDGGVVKILNRSGKPKANAIPLSIVSMFAGMAGGPWVFDGELVSDLHGSTLWLFDMPRALDKVLPSHPYEFRRQIMMSIIPALNAGSSVQPLPVFWEEDEKARIALHLLRRGAEGVMVKRLSAPYQPGARNTDCRKVKYRYDIDCVAGDPKTGLLNRDGKDNIVLWVFDENGDPFEVGVCTALAGDGSKVTVGDVVTVNYLYATDDRRLYQPTLPRIRDDKARVECKVDQLVFCDKTIVTAADLAAEIAA